MNKPVQDRDKKMQFNLRYMLNFVKTFNEQI